MTDLTPFEVSIAHAARTMRDSLPNTMITQCGAAPQVV
jgi:hypothetical protein